MVVTLPPPQPPPGRDDPGLVGEPVGWDPLVPVDFGGWIQRVFGVLRRDFPALALLAAIPAVLTGLSQAVLERGMPSLPTIAARINSGVRPVLAASPARGETFIRLLPAMTVFYVLILVVTAFAQPGAIFIMVRRAAGQPATVTAALRFAAPRVVPVLGWSILAGLLTRIGYVLHRAGLLSGIGDVLLITPGVYLSVVVFASLYGVVVIERAGLGRCFALIRGRFWVTLGRMVVGGLIAAVYSVALVLVLVVVAPAGAVFSAVVYGVLLVPVTVFFYTISTIIYAELRYHENPAATNTAALAAQLTRA